MSKSLPQIEVARVSAHHHEALAAFFRQVWDPEATPEAVSRARDREAQENPVDPGTPPPAFVLLRGVEALGYVSTIPTWFQVGGRRRGGHWVKGLWVLPDHRGGPVGFQVLQAAAAELDFLAALAVARPARRLFEALGFRDLGAPQNLVWPVAGFRIGSNLAVEELPGAHRAMVRYPVRAAQGMGLLGAAGAASRWLLRWSRGPGAIRTDARFRVRRSWDWWDSDRIDQLWSQLSRDGFQGVARDSAYLDRRYRGAREPEYRPLILQEGDAVSGVGLVRLPKTVHSGPLRGLRVAWLSELLVDGRGSTVRARVVKLAKAAEEMVRDHGGDLLVSSFSDPVVASGLKALRHLPYPGTMHLLVRDPEEDAGPSSAIWSVSRGDSYADEVS